MQLVFIISCAALVVLAALLVPVSSGSLMSQRSWTSTPAPQKRERQPYTPPLSGGERAERREGTPPKPTTQRPGSGLRTPTTRRVPYIPKTTPKTKPCNCSCNLAVGSPLCAGTDRDQETFANQCQLDCYNCTHNKRYKLIKRGEC